MNDYIKRKDAMDGMRNVDDAKHIRALPSADVAPIRHGRWEFDGEEGWWCSECGFETRLRWDYCPDCGAFMIEEVD